MDQSFEATLVRQCAPTLAGLKPGSLFCARAPRSEEVRLAAAHWDGRLRPMGLGVRLLLERPEAGSALVYVYRTAHLERVLAQQGRRRLLSERGYRPGGAEELLDQLAARLRTGEEFPHEIGLFLGYPLRDVVGFIENRGQNFTCCGLWKSYSDPRAMDICFACFRRCVNTYVRQFEAGVPIEQLAVPA